MQDRGVLLCKIEVDYYARQLREGFKKKIVEKYGLLPNPPRTPPPGLAFFPNKKFYSHFFLKIASIMAETNFALGPTSKTNKFTLLMVIICPELAGFK